MSDREAMKLALKALDTLVSPVGSIYAQARKALRAALAAPRPEPVADPFNCPKCGRHDYGLYGQCLSCSAQPAPFAAAPSEDIKALRRDAERYRYLRNRDPAEVMSKEGKDAGCWIDCEEKDDIAYMLQLLTGDDADAAIDAAVDASKEPATEPAIRAREDKT